ncbi:PepSY domain-containing protein [Streptomyces sp. NRRL WC-3549]|uniref:PepSY domain-containing protein n=1 Tax=Streptomyces sp. NRRL WC-3549 TaxID=1463925 RepID=UPI0004CA1BF6|nr:PepSY domain-containing protein [Streptomyces sp. NRRL WC-3549]
MRFESPRNKSVSPRTRRLRLAGALGVVLAAALVTGCGQDSGDGTSAATSEAAKVMPNQSGSPSASSGSPTSTAQLTEDQAKRKELLSAVKVPFSKAATTAVGEVSGGKLTELELEGVDDSDMSASPSADASGGAWMAHVVEDNGTAHMVTIDAVSGKVLDSKPDTDQSESDKQEMADRIAKAKQTPQQAAKVAMDKKKGTVTSVKLDESDSQALVWQVDVVTKDWKKTTFDVDAENGKITNEEVDND